MLADADQRLLERFDSGESLTIFEHGRLVDLRLVEQAEPYSETGLGNDPEWVLTRTGMLALGRDPDSMGGVSPTDE